MASKQTKPAAAADKPKTKVRRTPEGKIIPPNAGKGRPKGSLNKTTQTAKEAIAMLADGMTGELQGWLRAAAYGVGTAWVEWTPPEDWDKRTVPPGAKLLARGKLILAPVVDRSGQPVMFTLQDVMAGKLPVGATMDWIVKPAPGASTDTMLRALEYHIPKLSRAEVTGPGGSALIPATININGVKAPRRE